MAVSQLSVGFIFLVGFLCVFPLYSFVASLSVRKTFSFSSTSPYIRVLLESIVLLCVEPVASLLA